MSYLILGLSAILADIPGRIAVPISEEIWLSALARADSSMRKTIGVRRVRGNGRCSRSGRNAPQTAGQAKILPSGNILLPGAHNPDNITER